MPKALVQLKNINRAFSKGTAIIEALKAVTCAVKPKDRIAVVGASGSGKSTLLHLMGYLDNPTSGDISWPLLDRSQPLRPAQIGFIFQMPSLLPTLNVLENVELPLLISSHEPKMARESALESLGLSAYESALEALGRIGLSELADKLPDELSGGQLQRVAVARVLAMKPKLILADEPTGQLDHPTANKLLDAFLAAMDGTDTALVIATHDMAVAERMSTVWQISHGILEVIH